MNYVAISMPLTRYCKCMSREKRFLLWKKNMLSITSTYITTTSELFSMFHSLLMIIPNTFDLHLVVIA